MTQVVINSRWASLLVVIALAACETGTRPVAGSGGAASGSGGTGLGSGGSATNTGGASAGGTHADGTLAHLQLSAFKWKETWRVASTRCSMNSERVVVEVQHDDGGALLSVSFFGHEPGVHLTEYGGSMFYGEAGSAENSVSLQVQRAGSSVYTPEPCEIELLEFDRGELAAGGVGEPVAEIGSHARMRVSCPDGLQTPSVDDASGYRVHLSPSEFQLDASDCVQFPDY